MRAPFLLCLFTFGCVADGPSFGSGGDPFTDPGVTGGSDDTGESSDDTGTTSSDDTGAGDDTGGSTDDTGTLPQPEGSGWETGDIAYDLGEGDDWSLYAQLGTPVVLVAGHMDLQPTLDTLDAVQSATSSRSGLLTAAYLGRDEYQTAPDTDDQTRWAVQYDLDGVIIDPLLTSIDSWTDAGYAKLYVIGSDMEILWTSSGTTSESDLGDQLDELL